MKFITNKTLFRKELEVLKKSVSKSKGTYLESVFLLLNGDNLTLNTTDSKNHLRTNVVVRGEENGEIAVNVVDLINDLKAIPVDGDIIVETNGKHINLSIKDNDKFSNKLLFATAEQMPQVNFPSEKDYFAVEAKKFIKAINLTRDCISSEGSNTFIQGACLTIEDEEMVIVATDGRRLAHSKVTDVIDLPKELNNIIVATMFLDLITSISSKDGLIHLSIQGRTIFAEFDGYRLASETIDGHFPNYKQVIPEIKMNVTSIGREEMLESLNFISKKVNKRNNMFFLALKDGKMELKASNEDKGESSVKVECATDLTEECTWAFNINFMLDAIKALSQKTVVIEQITDPYKPIIVRNEDKTDGVFFLIMPLN